MRRKIFLDKLPDAILRRRESAKNRLECFWVALDVLRNAEEFTSSQSKAHEFEMVGESADGKRVFVHFREEISSEKDKRLFFVSCYHK